MNYKEITSEIVLTKNSKSGMWENEEVMFWKDEDYEGGKPCYERKGKN